MTFCKNIKKNNILVDPEVKNRWELIKEMVSLAVKNKEISKADEEDIIDGLIEREKSMSTGIGKGVAIPHCTVQNIAEPIILLAIHEKGINFDAIDNLPAKVIILLLVPKNKLSQHIKTLAGIAKMMSNDDVKDKIITLKKQEDIQKYLRDYAASQK